MHWECNAEPMTPTAKQSGATPRGFVMNFTGNQLEYWKHGIVPGLIELEPRWQWVPYSWHGDLSCVLMMYKTIQAMKCT